jgi:hypothetical protein
MTPVISRRTRFTDLSVVVCLFVHVCGVSEVCVSRLGVCMYEPMLQLYPDERLQKNTHRGNHLNHRNPYWLDGTHPNTIVNRPYSARR